MYDANKEQGRRAKKEKQQKCRSAVYFRNTLYKWTNKKKVKYLEKDIKKDKWDTKDRQVDLEKCGQIEPAYPDILTVMWGLQQVPRHGQNGDTA
jgi:hypothetical protein